jgi:hypothetical protein
LKSLAAGFSIFPSSSGILSPPVIFILLTQQPLAVPAGYYRREETGNNCHFAGQEGTSAKAALEGYFLIIILRFYFSALVPRLISFLQC